jgi:hypothetical protein
MGLKKLICPLLRKLALIPGGRAIATTNCPDICDPETGCDYIYYVHSCRVTFTSEPCVLGTETYYLCADTVIDGRTLADILASGDALQTLADGCWYLGERVAFADMEPGTPAYPYLASTSVVTDEDCDSAACEPDYSGACDCLCYTNDGPDLVCCYGFANDAGEASVWDFTETSSTVWEQTATKHGPISGGQVCADDCEGNASCEIFRQECETFGSIQEPFEFCAVAKQYRTRTVTNKSCCSDTNAPIDWVTASDDVVQPLTGTPTSYAGTYGPPARVFGCYAACYTGGMGTASGEIIYSELDGCVAKVVWSNTYSQDCTNVDQVCTSEDWTYGTALGDSGSCGCQIVIRARTDYALRITGHTLTADESRLCEMCDRALG